MTWSELAWAPWPNPVMPISNCVDQLDQVQFSQTTSEASQGLSKSDFGLSKAGTDLSELGLSLSKTGQTNRLPMFVTIHSPIGSAVLLA